jgi:hypothetical protein
LYVKRYRYVIVCSNGKSHDLAREDSFNPYESILGSGDKSYDLPDLLQKGWEPVRETPMGGNGSNHGGGGYSFSLVLLEKAKTETEPPMVELAHAVAEK